MTKKLNISVIQTNITWENPEKNRRNLRKIFKELPTTDLVLLPEMFTTGFSMQPKKLAEKSDGTTVQWLRGCAKELQVMICGSIIVKANGKYYNRFHMISPEEENYYDKRHLFRMGNEQQHYTAGTERKIIEYKGWRILPQICYDLRFPVWSRNRNDYDLLLYVANFPTARRHVWNSLLTARAIENQCYVAACNRIGTDGMNLSYSGDSQIICPKGKVISIAPNKKESIITETLSLPELKEFREKFPTYLDADNFTLSV